MQGVVGGCNGEVGTSSASVSLAPDPTHAQQQQTASLPVLTRVTPQSEFTVKPDFREVLARVQGVPHSQRVFTYDEV